MSKSEKKENYDFSGYATRFNIKCSDGRTIRPGAFKKNDGVKVPLVWNHNHSSVDNVLGHALLKEREDGMIALCSFNDTEDGKRAKKIVEHGDIVSLSIFANQLKQDSHLNVTEGNIREVSLVLAGANPGAFINNVFMHSADGAIVKDESGNAVIDEESAEIYIPDGDIKLAHSSEDNSAEEENNMENEQENTQTPPEETEEEENLQHAEGEDENDDENEGEDDETIGDVFDTLNPKQRKAVDVVVGVAVAEALEAAKSNSKEDKEDMKHNAFDNEIAIIKHNDEDGTDVKTTLSHEEGLSIIKDAKKSGSLRDAVLAHGITNIENLFPEAQSAGKPDTVSRNMEWVGKVMGSVSHSPFSKVKSMYFDITAEAARAKGYVTGTQKVEEVIVALKRQVSPQTVYKLQKLDRDDLIDITEFNAVAYIKDEMRVMLDEEIARAILIGDGRAVDDDYKISTDHIKPVWGDSSVYTVNRELTEDAEENFAKTFINDVIRSRKLYKGSGNPVLYTTEDMVTEMLLLEDKMGRPLYDTMEKLKTKLRVSDIITVEPMEGQYRRDANFQYDLLGVLVNLKDYKVGATKGGEVTMFDDFDINFNKYEYLIETRCSGALTKPYSAITFEKKHSF